MVVCLLVPDRGCKNRKVVLTVVAKAHMPSDHVRQAHQWPVCQYMKMHGKLCAFLKAWEGRWC